MSEYQTGDSMIWKSFKEGDNASFEQMYYLNFKDLFEYGVRLCNDTEAVKDSIQDLFVKIWNNKQNLADVANIKVYLLVSLRGLIYSKFQKKAKMLIQDLDESADFLMRFSTEMHIIKIEANRDKSQSLENAMNHVSPRQKEFIYLKYFQELGYDEIAAVMKISVKATYKLSARSLDALREILMLPKASLLLFAADAAIQSIAHLLKN